MEPLLSVKEVGEATMSEADALRDNQQSWADKVDRLEYELQAAIKERDNANMLLAHQNATNAKLIEENRVLREQLSRLADRWWKRPHATDAYQTAAKELRLALAADALRDNLKEKNNGH